ncbi:MAG: gamma-glutamylcyclotransferase family protein [Ketobacteraceae bacterium]|nr:gamma-glutamylcyclotransferase family protein [Ketobacteraceae bacterium]
MNSRLFCYGTLQAREVIESITGMTMQGQAAELQGYSCYRVKNAVYPGIIRSAGGKVPGTLFGGLHSTALARLDRFEGELYDRVVVPVIDDQGQTRKAWAYVIKTGCQHLLTREPWLYEEYESLFLERFRGFRNL